VKTSAYVDVQKVARDTINSIGYNKDEYMFSGNSCGVMSTIHEQSPDINQGVERQITEEQGAGDQGIMFGYATNETDTFMPLPLMLARNLLSVLDKVRENKELTYLRPDAKSQVTVEYEGKKPVRIDTIVLSTQHDQFMDDDEQMLQHITKDVYNKVILQSKCAELIDDATKIYVNPTGKFVIGGPHGDTGLTGRKIIVDTYGGRGAHGGGAFSGKDPSKVDRSGAYAARYIAKNIVAAGLCDECLVQLAYAIGVAKPVGLYLNTNGTNHTSMNDDELSVVLFNSGLFPMTPYEIIKRFELKNPIYSETAKYGAFGHEPHTTNGVKYFEWEQTDLTDKLRALAGME
jgi:S-adenosylmethionine synthetase